MRKKFETLFSQLHFIVMVCEKTDIDVESLHLTWEKVEGAIINAYSDGEITHKEYRALYEISQCVGDTIKIRLKR